VGPLTGRNIAGPVQAVGTLCFGCEQAAVPYVRTGSLAYGTTPALEEPGTAPSEERMPGQGRDAG
jgi:hypothetical protein